MEPVIIETLDNPFCRLRLESSQSHSSYSDLSDGEETEINYDDLLEQLKNLSFEEVLDPKHTTSKFLTKISEINSTDNSGKLTLVEKAAEKNRISSSLKNKKSSKCVVDVESMFCKCSTKNCEITSNKKIITEKLSFEENLENVENRLSSLSVKNEKFINKNYKSGPSISAGHQYDSDNDDQEESVILRARDPTRHNRTENNKQQRPTPLSRNHTKPFKSHFNLNNHQTSENGSPYKFYDFNTSHDYDYINHLNNTEFGTVPPSNTLVADISLESVTYEAFEEVLSSKVADEIFNDIPCTAANPCTVADQIVEGIPYTVDAVLDSVIGNSNDKFFEEINNATYFDNLKERTVLGSEVSNVENETFLVPCLEYITEEELDNILRDFSDSELNNPCSQNSVDLVEEFSLNIPSCKEFETVFSNSILSQDICATPIAKVSYPNDNEQNFFPESNHGHSSILKANVEQTSFSPNLCKEDDIFEKTGQFYISEYLVNKSGNNERPINQESLPPKTRDYLTTSNEIEDEIAKVKEMEELVKKGLKNVSELSCEIDWNDELDVNRMSSKKDDSERKNIKQTCKTPCKIEKTKICWILGTTARNKLLNSSSFCKRKCELEKKEITQEIKSGILGTKENKVIHVLKKDRKLKYRGSNLHKAILSENIEKVFCLVELHKECHNSITEINLRDTFNKTVLDYSMEKGLDLLSDYLKENTAKESISIK